MAGEMYEKYYDSEKPEECVYDNEQLSKNVKDIQKIFTKDISTKDEFDVIESNLRHWHDGDVTPEMLGRT